MKAQYAGSSERSSANKMDANVRELILKMILKNVPISTSAVEEAIENERASKDTFDAAEGEQFDE